MAYRQTEKGRATRARCQARYYQSEKGRAYRARYHACYYQSEKGRMVWARYHQSEKCRAKRARYQQDGRNREWHARYSQTAAGRVTRALRYARERNAIVLEAVDRHTIFVLDGGLCHLCDLPVNADTFHVDHVIPLVVEPIHAEFNCAVAHASCNTRKGARTVGLSPTARARWQECRPAHLALLDEHLTRLAA